MRRVTSDLGPGGKAEGPGWTVLKRQRQTEGGSRSFLEVQVGVRQVATGDPQEGLPGSFGLLPLPGPQGLLGDLHGFWGGEKGAGGDEEGWRTPASWALLRRKLPWLPLSQVPGGQVRGLGMWEGEVSQVWELQSGPGQMG